MPGHRSDPLLPRRRPRRAGLPQASTATRAGPEQEAHHVLLGTRTPQGKSQTRLLTRPRPARAAGSPDRHRESVRSWPGPGRVACVNRPERFCPVSAWLGAPAGSSPQTVGARSRARRRGRGFDVFPGGVQPSGLWGQTHRRAPGRTGGRGPPGHRAQAPSTGQSHRPLPSCPLSRGPWRWP